MSEAFRGSFAMRMPRDKLLNVCNVPMSFPSHHRACSRIADSLDIEPWKSCNERIRSIFSSEIHKVVEAQ